jgi:hypothetical protein
MRLLFNLFFLAIVLNAASQDKLYYINGSSKLVFVREINPNEIIIETDSTTETILKEEVLLIEYKNGLVDVFNSPKESKIINLNSQQKNNLHNQNKPLFNYNLVSINTLALCNADASAFYERILQNKKIGFGVMGAYNFNPLSIGPNTFINILNNAKKNYDLGIYCNFYPRAFSKKTFITYGILFKQTNFSFNLVTEDTIKIGGNTSTNINYKYTKGNQFATLFNIGTNTTVLSNCFIKTYFGLGGFNLRGDYKKAYNAEYDKNNISNNNNTPPEKANFSFLPKLYIGINIGYAF